ncbi:MAG TPA: flagellar hook protein FliD, partial [Firmicutes bacterium]|nr:flagellar hook protein FliD [Candidatus Fermentithermobacillaceae bacterium]
MAISLNLTGLDTDFIIQQLMAIERQPLQRLESQRSLLVKRKSAWDSIRTKMSNVATRLTALTGVATFNAKKVQVANTAVVTATASA